MIENFTNGPTWDLLLGVCLALIILYGFIIGQAKTIKILLALYPAYFFSDMIGSMLPGFLGAGPNGEGIFSFFHDLRIAIINGNTTRTIDLSPSIDLGSSFDFTALYWLVGIKIFFFLLFWLLITIKAPFSIDMPENSKKIGNAFLHFIYSLSFGVLFMNVVLLLLSGYSIFSYNLPTHILYSYMDQSFLITLFVKFYGSWFAFPAFVMVVSGFLYAPVEEEPDPEEEISTETVQTPAA